MANLLSITATLVLTSLFYAPLIPIAVPIALLGLLLSYWVEKFNLLRVHRVPEMLNGVLPIFFSNLLPYFAFLWSIMFYSTFNQFISLTEEKEQRKASARVLSFVALGLSAAFILFPIRSIINWCSSDSLGDLYDSNIKYNE